MRPVTILFDMDGVLADFVGGALRAHGREPGVDLHRAAVTWDFPAQVGFPLGAADPAFWQPLHDPDFWERLEPLADGLALFALAESAFGVGQIGLLSSGVCPGSCDGKRRWLRRHLPAYEKRVAFLHAKEMVAAPCKLLIDDHEPNADGFTAAGGRSLLVPRPWNRRRSETCPHHATFDPSRLFDELTVLAG